MHSLVNLVVCGFTSILWSVTMRVWLVSLSLAGDVVSLVPGACETNACVATADFCSEHLPGVYRNLGPFCPGRATCSDCSVIASGAIRCKCETLPVTTTVDHGQTCSAKKTCASGDCFQDCDKFLFKPTCPPGRCGWDDDMRKCLSSAPAASFPDWSTIGDQPALIVAAMPSSLFPLSFSAFKTVAGQYVSHYLTVSVDTLFLLLDLNMDGYLTYEEFSVFPAIVGELHAVTGGRRLTALIAPLTGSDVAQCLSLTSESSAALRAACAAPSLQGEICAADGGKNFCLIDKTCVTDCNSCGWLTVENRESHRCGPASVAACAAVGAFFCPQKTACVPDCKDCDEMVADTITGVCRSVWWLSVPDSTCRFTHAADQACVSDIDCVFGDKKCVASKCVPAATACESHRDCGVGFYCPTDPSGGHDPYFNQTCKPQLTEGGACVADSDCVGTTRCHNSTCTRLFSLSVGAEADRDEMCMSGQTSGGHCSGPFRSLRLAQTCETDTDCPTSAGGSETGECKCIGWWESGACKRCQPVTGDLSNFANSWRTFMYLRGTLCHTVWSLDECLREQQRVKTAYNAYMCELQTLSGGITRLSDPVCIDGDAEIDFCSLSVP